jgi:hypothetical protein
MNPKRGRKSGLPPRVPDTFRGPGYGLPRLRHIDFANEKILSALKRAGWSPPNSNDVSEVFSEHQLNNDIRWVVQSYLLAKVAALEPTVFRRELRELNKALGIVGKTLDVLVAKIPTADSPVGLAIQEKWNQQCCEDLDCPICGQRYDRELLWDRRFGIEYLRSNLTEFGKIVRHVIDDESGAGRDAHRAERELIGGLAEIFERRTGKIPTRDSDPQSKCESSSPFHSFVETVDELLPAEFRLLDIDNLIRHHLERTVYPRQAS